MKDECTRSEGKSAGKENAYEFHWYCCSHLSYYGGMSTRIDHCDDCQHLRCSDCFVEAVKLKKEDLLPPAPSSGISSQSHFSRQDAQVYYNSELSFNDPSKYMRHDHSKRPNFGKTALVRHVSIPRQDLTSLSPSRLDARITSPKALDQRKFIQNSRRDEIHSQTKLTGSPAFTNRSDTVEKSVSTISIFTDEEVSKQSDTDVGDAESDSDFDDDNNDDNEGARIRNQFLTILDSCVLSVFDHDLSFAAQIISRIHHAVPSPFDWHNVRDTITTAGDDRPSTSNSSYNGPSTTESAADVRRSFATQNGKRKINSDDNDESDRASQVQRKKRAGPSLKPVSVTFACHFNKKDPAKYSSFTSDKYRNCLHPRIPSIRRIKDHFKNHLIAQCDNCFAIFENKTELVDHRGPSKLCSPGEPRLKEGIDDGQWEKIEHLVKAKSFPGRQDFEKWYDIWAILFPSLPPPPNPWSEPNKSVPSTSPLDVDGIIENISAFVADIFRRGTLPAEEFIHQQCSSIIRHGLQSLDQIPRTDINRVESENHSTIPGENITRRENRNFSATQTHESRSSNEVEIRQPTPFSGPSIPSIEDQVPMDNDLGLEDLIEFSSFDQSLVNNEIHHSNIVEIDYDYLDQNIGPDGAGDLSAILEQELELPTPVAPIKGKHDRNRGLSGRYLGDI